ncbi:hypothetical protein [Flammeovirga sp. OC4]|uniref:hypothetical protein n=1 Tax=Flammeovirga sp. OC4 TaxID=1382345 RepID=UPI0005C50843|nr:hypothetical protein [Flammeovirga sp. OC4]
MIKVTKFSDIIFLIIGFSASAWSAYWSQIFFASLVPVVYSWIIAVFVFGVAGHALSKQAIQEFIEDKNYTSPALLMFLIILGSGVYIDFNGIDIHTEKAEVSIIENHYDSLVNVKQVYITSLLEQKKKNSDWSIGKVNWAKQAQFENVKAELKTARSELDALKSEAKTEIKKAANKANKKSESLSGGVLIAYLLLILSNYGLVDSQRKSKNESLINTNNKINELPTNPTPPTDKKKKPTVGYVDDDHNDSSFDYNIDTIVGNQPLNVINQRKSTQSATLKVTVNKDFKAERLIKEYPETTNLIKQGQSIRKSMQLAGEMCKFHNAQKIASYLKHKQQTA